MRLKISYRIIFQLPKDSKNQKIPKQLTESAPKEFLGRNNSAKNYCFSLLLVVSQFIMFWKPIKKIEQLLDKT